MALFPCNQFGQQEPDDIYKIRAWAHEKKGVKQNAAIYIFEKGDCNGENVYKLLKILRARSSVIDKKRGKCGEIPWNIAKFLVNGDGELID